MAGTRLEIVASFIAFALALAPFAWNIIQVERVEIKYDRIESLYRQWIESNITQNSTQSIVIVYSNEAQLHSDTQAHAFLIGHKENSLQWIFRHGKKEFNGNSARIEAMRQYYREIASSAPVNSFHIFFVCDEKSTDSTVFVGTERYAWTSSCSMQQTDGLLESISRLVDEHVQFDAVEDIKSTHRARRSHRYRLDFTLLKLDGMDTWHWDLNRLLTEHLDPVLSKVRDKHPPLILLY